MEDIPEALDWLIDFYVFNATYSNISAIYHGDQWWKKPEYTERTTYHGQVTGISLITFGCESSAPFFGNLQSRARTHAVLMIGLYELLGNPTT